MCHPQPPRDGRAAFLKTVDCIRSKWWGCDDTRHDTGNRTLRSTTSYLRGTEHEHLPAEFLNGRLIVKEYRAEPVIFTRVSRLTEELYFGLRVSFLPVLAIELSPLAG